MFQLLNVYFIVSKLFLKDQLSRKNKLTQV